jgi:predicted P-loop ATPase
MSDISPTADTRNNVISFRPMTEEDRRELPPRSEWIHLGQVVPIGEPSHSANEPFDVTFFDDEFAKRKRVRTTTLAGLREYILRTVMPEKAKLPWLKLARFGDKKTEKGSLRHDANVIDITGIELDYDLKQVSLAAAIDVVKRNRLRCLLYTSPSYTEAEPKWRIICPTSKPLPPAKRERLARGVDAMFGNIFATESFTLSQSYYYGSVSADKKPNPAHQCEVFDGAFVDEMELPAVEAPRAPTTNGDGRAESEAREKAEFGDLYDDVLSGRVLHPSLLRLAAKFVEGGLSVKVTKDALYGLMDQSAARQDDAERWKHRRGQIPELVESAIDKYGKARWRGRHRDGTPVATMHNAQVAITAVGVECSYDTFHNKLLVGYRGEALHELQHALGEMTDHAVIALREILGNRFGTDFGDKHVRDAIVALANKRRFDPVRDMLDHAQAAWDGKKRLDKMAVDYFNCEDTKLNRAIVRKTMIAAVRRARRPGCKFDNITVLESEEGWLKSTAWRVLAGDENFSDESILGRSGREIQEQLSEVWIHESADLAGMRKAEVESVKAFASRQVDIARPAYGYFVRKQPRHAINVGTTNSDEYLQSQTGNRRFWPLKVLRPIDIAKLERDRLQLWGEAAACEAKGESLTFAQDLWPAAVEEQEKRRVKDPWEEILADIPETVEVKDREHYDRYGHVRHCEDHPRPHRHKGKVRQQHGRSHSRVGGPDRPAGPSPRHAARGYDEAARLAARATVGRRRPAAGVRAACQPCQPVRVRVCKQKVKRLNGFANLANLANLFSRRCSSSRAGWPPRPRRRRLCS